MVSINNLSVEFSAKALFDNVTYVINRRDKIALVGKNGAGKSTMLKIIAGLQRPTSGSVSVARDMTIGYLPQQMVLADDTTCIEEASKAFAHIDRMQQRLDELNAELAERTDYDSQSYQDLIDAMTSLTERLAMEQSDNKRAETEKTLLGLGFTRGDFDRPTSEFSGGWRMRIELAKILLSRPDILLLDEPTNHLDIVTKDVLKEAIRDFNGTVIVVSHDRYFLDGLVDKVYEFGGGHVRENLGGIYDFLRKKNLDSLRQLELSKSPTGSRNTDTTTGRPTESQSAANQTPTAPDAKAGRKLSYAEQKERARMISRAEKAVKAAEQEVETKEKELADAEAALAVGDSSPQTLERYDKAKRGLETAMAYWEKATMDLEELQN